MTVSRDLLAVCIERFGVVGDWRQGMEGHPDRRVAFLMLHNEKTLEVMDFVAVPPSGVEWLSRSLGLYPRDFHIGWDDEQIKDSEEIGRIRARIGRNIDEMSEGFMMHSSLLPRFLHARRLAYQANPRGRVWGTSADFPPEVKR